VPSYFTPATSTGAAAVAALTVGAVWAVWADAAMGIRSTAASRPAVVGTRRLDMVSPSLQGRSAGSAAGSGREYGPWIQGPDIRDRPATLPATMFITRKHIKGSNDRGAWPWRSWHDFI